jgi:carbonic anhydrase
MSVIDQLVRNNNAYAKTFQGDLPLQPARRLAVLACMDSRLDVFQAIGLAEGEAHVIRNAGGLVTDDAIRSLAISQRILGTREIMLIHHTGCGMLAFDDDEFRRELERETGIQPGWAAETFGDPDSSIRRSVARVVASPFVPHTDVVRGFVFDVKDGTLREVTAA